MNRHHYALCIAFVLFLKGQILRKFQNFEKFVMLWTKHDFVKGMHSYVSNIGVNWNLSKKAQLNKNSVSFPLAFKETRNAPYISYPISEYLHYHHTSVRSNKATELVFLFLLLVYFSFSLILSLLVLFLICILWNAEKTHLKCKQICKLLSCF